MKKTILIAFLPILLIGCESNGISSFPSIDGGVFIRTSYILETPIDANGDGVFSTDIILEQDCGADAMIFTPGETVANPLFNDMGFTVTTDSNGVKTQNISCLIADGIYPTYQQIDNEVYLLYGEVLEIVGEISSDGSQITFHVPREKLIGMNIGGNALLQSDGSIVQYEGGALLVYDRQ